jgi:hypothetical protein
MHNTYAAVNAVQMNPKQKTSNKYCLEEWMMTTRKTLGYLLILIKKYRVHT